MTVIAAAPGTPPCAPPTLDDSGGCSVTRYADVRAALVDPALQVPEAEPGAPGTLDWLRGVVARFSGPGRHPGRRAATLALLANLDPAALTEDTARLTGAALDRCGDRLDVAARLARDVPLRPTVTQRSSSSRTGSCRAGRRWLRRRSARLLR